MLMKKPILALAAAALLATALSAPAQARCRGCGVAAGVVGGLAVGALLGSALAGPRYAEPVYDVAPPPPPRRVYVERRYYYEAGPVCHVERHKFWARGYGWRYRRVEVCE
jgi:hypothetical protein